MADLENDDRKRASAWELVVRILTALAYVVGIAVALLIVLALAYAIVRFEIRLYHFLRRYRPGPP